MDTFSVNDLLTSAWKTIEPRLLILLVMTVIDFLFGTILALVAKKFQWSYLANYLNTDILPILAWMAAALIGAFPVAILPDGALPIMADVIYATVFIKLSASVVGHFQKVGVLKEDHG